MAPRDETGALTVTLQNSSTADEQDNLAGRLGDAHVNLMTTGRLLVCMSALGLANMVAFIDQTGITIALSAIGTDLDCQDTIYWAGTASFLANCVCQVLFGRLSDIFGRKGVLVWCLLILGVADIACGICKTGIQFYIFRAFAGIGNGGVSSLGMVILSDIVTLKQRGKYQGILGSSVGIGNAVGPFLMAAFTQHYSWRGFYYLLAPLAFSCALCIHFLIDGPPKEYRKVLSTKRSKFINIDYCGIVAATAALTPLLIALSGGGSAYAWNSKPVIALFCAGGLSFCLFLLIEWRVARLPMVPLCLFKKPSLCLLLFSNVLFGAAYFSFLYYLPYFFQIVKGKDAIRSATMVLPLFLSQSIMSIISGHVISFTGHYIHVVIVGYSCWLVACGLLLLWNENLSDQICVVILLLMGTGVGWTFQPTMIAVQAQAKKAERAVVISTRNVMRSFGGAVGVAAGSTVISNTVTRCLSRYHKEGTLSAAQVESIRGSLYNDMSAQEWTPAQYLVIKKMYTHALHNYFLVLIPLIGVCLAASFFVRDRGLQCIDEIDGPNECSNESTLGSGFEFDSEPESDPTTKKSKSESVRVFEVKNKSMNNTTNNGSPMSLHQLSNTPSSNKDTAPPLLNKTSSSDKAPLPPLASQTSIPNQPLNSSLVQHY